MGHSKAWLLAQLVPADVGVVTELLLQANPEGLCIRGSIQTTLLGEESQPYLAVCLSVKGKTSGTE